MQRIFIIMSLFLIVAGCSSVETEPLLERSADWIEETGDKLRTWGKAETTPEYDAEVDALFQQPMIDPLTDYLRQYSEDESRAAHLRKVLEERDRRCDEVSARYATRPVTRESLNLYKAGYNYSCPKQVAAFAEQVVKAEQDEKTQDGEKNVEAKAIATTEPAEKNTDRKPAEQESVTAEAEPQQQLASVSPSEVDIAARQQLNDCYLLTTINNYREARQACLQPAEQGDARAQLNMAIISKALHQYDAALQWAKQVEPQSPQARYLLGQLYSQGLGVIQDDTAALNWYRQAANDGHAAAEFQTALFLAEGRGTAQDDQAARSWYERSAVNGYADAQYAMGLMLLNGIGGPASVEDGRDWLLQAARQGQVQATMELGYIEQQGLLSRADKARALVWYELAEQNGSEEAGRRAQLLREQVAADALIRARLEVLKSLEGDD